MTPPQKRKNNSDKFHDPDSPEPKKRDDGENDLKEDKEDHQDLEINCPFCEKCSSSIEDYLEHQKRHPPAKNREPLRLYCNKCSYSSLVIDHLRKHLMRHYNIKPFKCPFCSCRYVTKYQLRQHDLNHHLNLKPKRDDY